MAEEIKNVVYDDCEVVKEQMFKTYRQVVTCPDQEAVPQILAGMHSTIRAGRFTGTVTIACNLGGVRTITTEEIAELEVDASDED